MYLSDDIAVRNKMLMMEVSEMKECGQFVDGAVCFVED